MAKKKEISFIDAIKERTSVRSYKNTEVITEEIQELTEFLASVKSPFSNQYRIEFINKDIAESNGGKIGTYGVIKGANLYGLGIVKRGENDLEQIGYVLEMLILKSTAMGLGTCWLGGTFNKNRLLQSTNLDNDEFLAAITPIGYGEGKKRFIDTTIRYLAGSDKRKPWNELFYKDNFDSKLLEEEAGEFKLPLEMVRIAPSASNKQPWRILKQGEKIHFYLSPTKGYGDALGFNIQRIDLGIAMCHFEVSANQLGLKGRWEFLKPDLDTSKDYVATWVKSD